MAKEPSCSSGLNQGSNSHVLNEQSAALLPFSIEQCCTFKRSLVLVINLTHNTYVWKKNLDADNPDFFTTAKLAAPALARSDMMNQPPPIQLMNHPPPKTRLLQNIPNPFNPETWIAYELAEDVNVSIQIYDTTGRLVRALDLGHRPAGYYVDRAKAAYWDGRNDAGERVASGLYLYRLNAGNFSAVRRMLILK